MAITQFLSSFAKRGFINYCHSKLLTLDQDSVPSRLIGLAMLTENWNLVVKLILNGNEGDYIEETGWRSAWESGDVQTVASLCPSGREAPKAGQHFFIAVVLLMSYCSLSFFVWQL